MDPGGNPRLLPEDGLQSAGDVIFLVIDGFLSHGNLHVGIALEMGKERNTKIQEWDSSPTLFRGLFQIPSLSQIKLFWEFGVHLEKRGIYFKFNLLPEGKKKIKEEIQFHLEDFTWIYRDPPSQSHPKIPWKKHPGQVFSSLLPDFPLSADLFFKEWLGNGARGMEWAARHSLGWDQPQENSHPRGNLGSDFGLFEDLHGKAPFCSFLLFNPWELLKFLRNETLPFQIHFKKWRKIQKWLEFLHLFFHVFHIYFPYSIHDFHMFFHIFSYLFIIFP